MEEDSTQEHWASGEKQTKGLSQSLQKYAAVLAFWFLPSEIHFRTFHLQEMCNSHFALCKRLAFGKFLQSQQEMGTAGSGSGGSLSHLVNKTELVVSKSLSLSLRGLLNVALAHLEFIILP